MVFLIGLLISIILYIGEWFEFINIGWLWCSVPAIVGFIIQIALWGLWGGDLDLIDIFD